MTPVRALQSPVTNQTPVLGPTEHPELMFMFVVLLWCLQSQIFIIVIQKAACKLHVEKPSEFTGTHKVIISGGYSGYNYNTTCSW